MPSKSLIPSTDFCDVRLDLNPHKNHEDLYRYHKFACKTAPDALVLRDVSAFENNPVHAMLSIQLKGAEDRTVVGAVVGFDVDVHTVEVGSFFVSPLVRGLGFGQLLMDALVTKINDENNLASYPEVTVIAKVRYGNYGPIPILNRCGFRVTGISDHKVHWKYDPKSALQTAHRLYDRIISAEAQIEDDLFHALCSVHGSVRNR